jgi:excisionase family DNA binding protein
MEEQDELITIGEAGRLLGVCQDTLRDWDRKGLFPAVRTAGNQRRFRLSEVKRVQAEGFSKGEIKGEPCSS